tara:strand:+ start:310 stop:546 length:237 start_codon:yes stop_codon:yes gene_type:complete
MSESVKQLAQEIAINFQKSIKERVDELLELDCDQYCNMGTDTGLEERIEVKENSKHIYNCIKGINEPIGSSLLDFMDE